MKIFNHNTFFGLSIVYAAITADDIKLVA